MAQFIQCTQISTAITCNITNCQFCTTNNICATCLLGTTYNSTSNTCTPTCNTLNCYICNIVPGFTTQCLVCLPGYVFNPTTLQCLFIPITCGSSCSNNSCIINLNTLSGQCVACNPGNVLYNGVCYMKTCNIYGCDICAPWSTNNT